MTLKKTEPGNPVRLLLRIPVPWVFILTYLLGLIFQFFLPLDILSPKAMLYLKISGILLFVSGAFFALWSLIIFHKASTTTTPGERSKMLITKGPYRLSRNPMYISLFLAYLGEAGLLAQFWPVVVLPLLLLYLNRIVIPLEEKILRDDFRDDYEKYCNEVHRWL